MREMPVPELSAHGQDPGSHVRLSSKPPDSFADPHERGTSPLYTDMHCPGESAFPNQVLTALPLSSAPAVPEDSLEDIDMFQTRPQLVSVNVDPASSKAVTTAELPSADPEEQTAVALVDIPDRDASSVPVHEDAVMLDEQPDMPTPAPVTEEGVTDMVMAEAEAGGETVLPVLDLKRLSFALAYNHPLYTAKDSKAVYRHIGEGVSRLGGELRTADPRGSASQKDGHESSRRRKPMPSVKAVVYEWDQYSVGTPPPLPPTAITVSNMSSLTTMDKILRIFGEYGAIDEHELAMDKQTSGLLGICHLKFRDEVQRVRYREGHKPKIVAGKAHGQDGNMSAKSAVQRQNGQRTVLLTGMTGEKRLRVELDGDGTVFARLIAEATEEKRRRMEAKAIVNEAPAQPSATPVIEPATQEPVQQAVDTAKAALSASGRSASVAGDMPEGGRSISRLPSSSNGLPNGDAGRTLDEAHTPAGVPATDRGWGSPSKISPTRATPKSDPPRLPPTLPRLPGRGRDDQNNGEEDSDEDEDSAEADRRREEADKVFVRARKGVPSSARTRRRSSPQPSHARPSHQMHRPGPLSRHKAALQRIVDSNNDCLRVAKTDLEPLKDLAPDPMVLLKAFLARRIKRSTVRAVPVVSFETIRRRG